MCPHCGISEEWLRNLTRRKWKTGWLSFSSSEICIYLFNIGEDRLFQQQRKVFGIRKNMSPTLFKVIAWIFTIITLSGNCFIVILIVSRKHLRSSKLNWFIISLAVADFLVGLSFYPPLFFCERSFSCHTILMDSFRWIFIYSSVSNLCAMTVDRYVAHSPGLFQLFYAELFSFHSITFTNKKL